MGVVVQFNYPAWAQTFTEFAYINQAQATSYFNLATQFVRNDGGGPVDDPTTQSNFLNMVTAHIAKLMAPLPNGQPAATLVGRISNASEGSVSVTADMGTTTQQEAFFNQTEYGAMYWAASRPYRTMRWKVPQRRVMNPWAGWGFGAGRWGY